MRRNESDLDTRTHAISDPDADAVYYPFGVLGKGYVLPQRKHRRSIRNIIVTHGAIAFSTYPLRFLLNDYLSETFTFVVIICVIGVIGLNCVRSTLRVVKKAGAQSVPRNLMNALRSTYAYYPRAAWLLLLVFSVVGAIAFVVLALYAMVADWKLFAVIAFFLFAGLTASAVLYANRKYVRKR